MNVQWYPGHMTKAVRSMQEDIKLVDLIIELLDARLPMSSRNPDINKLGQGKARLILLNKADLSDARENERWLKFFKASGAEAVLLDSRNNTGMAEVRAAIKAACREKTERDRRRGIKNRPVRAMVAGIPNVGKSTFINSFAKKAVAKTGNKPGVTKGKQWIRLSNELELLDTPGILWPKFEDESVGLHLAMTGSINDEILPREELAMSIIALMKQDYPGRLAERYEADEQASDADILIAAAKRLGCIKKGGEPDTLRAAALITDDLRAGRLGRISIERAEAE